jgi:DNA-binding transcriptional ArsR family regulator
MPENSLEITDPRAMRALAHPARIAILQHLVIEGPATATECAEVAGLSPSACSYHLRALASHGFVEEDLASAADGRHRPWRARVNSMHMSDEPGQSIAVQAAGRLLKESLRARIEEVREQYLEREAEYPPEWLAASGLAADVVHVTPDELDMLRHALQELLSDYRRLDRAERPPGAKRVHVLQEFLPWFDPGDDQ